MALFGIGFLLAVAVVAITIGVCLTKTDANYIKAKEKEANLKLELAKSEEAINIAKIEADKEVRIKKLELMAQYKDVAFPEKV